MFLKPLGDEGGGESGDGKEETRGRKPVALDLVKLQALCQVHATDEEIAAHLGVSVRTIERRRHDDPEFAAFFAKGHADGKISLRRAQFTKALKGDTGMLIWLGRQLLGQKDLHEITGLNGGPVEVNMIQRLLDQLSEEELRRWAQENGVTLPAELLPEEPAQEEPATEKEPVQLAPEEPEPQD
jgi:hypothetical protein